MTRPVQSFDVQPMARGRVRGTQDQTVGVISWLLQQMQARSPGRFTCAVSSSGPVRDSEARQHYVHFYISNDLVDELRRFLGVLGIEEET